VSHHLLLKIPQVYFLRLQIHQSVLAILGQR
jgi:hypothetical protein